MASSEFFDPESGLFEVELRWDFKCMLKTRFLIGHETRPRAYSANQKASFKRQCVIPSKHPSIRSDAIGQVHPIFHTDMFGA